MFSEGSWTWANGQPVKFGKTPGAFPWEEGEPNVRISHFDRSNITILHF